jgi:hypothetical protein
MHWTRQNYGLTHVGPGTKLAGPWCTQPQILDLPGLDLDPLNFHNFLNFHQPKVHFVTKPSKTPEFYPMKNVSEKRKRKKGIAVFIKKERERMITAS